MSRKTVKKAMSKGLEEAELVDFDELSNPWTTLKLKDGTILKVKIVVQGVLRLNRYDEHGFPAYAIKSTNVLRIAELPENLRRKLQKPGVT